MPTNSIQEFEPRSIYKAVTEPQTHQALGAGFEFKEPGALSESVHLAREAREAKTLEELEQVRSDLQNDENFAHTYHSKLIEVLKNDIDDYLGLGAINESKWQKFQDFYRSRWGRWTRLGLGFGLATTALVSLAMGFLPGVIAAVAGRVLMTGAGSFIFAQELQESYDLHRETSKKDSSWSEKIKGFFVKTTIELDWEEIQGLSRIEAGNKVAKTLARAKTMRAKFDSHRQPQAWAHLIDQATVPVKRKIQLMRALNNRLLRQGQKVDFSMLEAMVAKRVYDRRERLVVDLAKRAQQYEFQAQQEAQARLNRSLAAGGVMGLAAGLLGFDKAVSSYGALEMTKVGSVEIVGVQPETVISGNEVILPDISVAESASASDFIEVVNQPVDLTFNESIQSEVSAYVSKANLAHINSPEQLDPAQIKHLNQNLLDSALIREKIGSLDGEELSARLNFAAKASRGELIPTNVEHDFGDTWITFQEDGRNAWGIEVADPREIQVKFDTNGNIADAIVTRSTDFTTESIESTPTVQDLSLPEPSEQNLVPQDLDIQPSLVDDNDALEIEETLNEENGMIDSDTVINQPVDLIPEVEHHEIEDVLECELDIEPSTNLSTDNLENFDTKHDWQGSKISPVLPEEALEEQATEVINQPDQDLLPTEELPIDDTRNQLPQENLDQPIENKSSLPVEDLTTE